VKEFSPPVAKTSAAKRIDPKPLALERKCPKQYPSFLPNRYLSVNPACPAYRQAGVNHQLSTKKKCRNNPLSHRGTPTG
jgi:hypothetical protein